MGFFQSLERKVFRPIGRVAKQAAPIALGIGGTMIGGPVGGALGSAIGGSLKKGRFDVGDFAKDAGLGLLTGGIASKLGLGGMGRDVLKSGNAAVNAAMPGVNAAIANGGDIAARGIGGAVKGAVANEGSKWLNGKTIAALGDAATAGYGAYNQDRYFKLQQKQYDAAEAQRRKDAERDAGMDPARAMLFKALASRLGVMQ